MCDLDSILQDTCHVPCITRMTSEPPQTEQPEKPRNTRKRIIVADDRDENRYYLQVLLGGSGYEVVGANNGEEVLGMLRSGGFDAVISDILMPVMDGFILCRTIKEDPELAQIPFIFYSASYTEQKDREFGLSLGADEYISKPIEPEDLLRIITAIFKRKEQGSKDSEVQSLPDNLSFYTSYADTLGRKLDRKVAESDQYREEARFSEEKYRLFLKNLQGIGYLIGLGEEIPMLFEGQVEETTGYPAADFLSGRMKWLDLIYPEDKLRYFHKKTGKGSVSGDTLSEQYRIHHRNGEIRWVHEISTCLPDQPADLTLVQGAIYDITLQKQAEEEIRRSEEHYRTLFETMAEGIVFLDKNGNIISANPSAERILGLSLDQLQGRTNTDPGWKCVREDGSPFPGEEHPSLVSLRTGEIRQDVMGVFNPTEERYHWILVNAVPQFNQGESVPYQVFITFEDITTAKEARDHSEHLNRVLQAIRMVNLYITTETDKGILLHKVCSFLTEMAGYSGVWIRTDSETGHQVFQAVSDLATIDDQFVKDISQGDVQKWIPERMPESQIIVRSVTGGDAEGSVHEEQGVMIARLSYEGIEYGSICACMPALYLHDPDEQSLYLEIARDIGFSLHHLMVVSQEETTRNALLASEKQYRDLVENISDALFTLHPDGRIAYISPAIRRITGFDPSRYTGHHFIDYIDPVDRDPVNQWYSAVLLNHASPVELTIADNMNRKKHLRVTAVPVLKNEVVAEVSGIITDITAWKESERLKAAYTREVQALLALHLLTHEPEDRIFSFVLEAAVDITQSKVGFIALVKEGGKKIDFQIWSSTVMETCSVQNPSSHRITSSQGIWYECINTRKPVIINDFESSSGFHGYPEGHLPVRRFLVVPILDGNQVSAIIAVANRSDPYTDSHARTLNTLGNTLWEIIQRKRSDQEIEVALTRIAQNMEQLATLNDEIRNPLTIISLISEIVGEEYHNKIMEAVNDIDDLVDRLDQGWIQSEKVRNFLIKHYQFTKKELGSENSSGANQFYHQ